MCSSWCSRAENSAAAAVTEAESRTDGATCGYSLRNAGSRYRSWKREIRRAFALSMGLAGNMGGSGNSSSSHTLITSDSYRTMCVGRDSSSSSSSSRMQPCW
eukprot:GHUV01030578.1.p2 GENE.GHUV01030578.1~~GHUV01030578.1.p2  ORF type:complete len:102 (-),score=15.34 GHUV01030578.1:40-345(-)